MSPTHRISFRTSFHLLTLAGLIAVAGPAAAQSGPYVAGFAGVANYDDSTATGVNSSSVDLRVDSEYDPGLLAGGAIGYRFEPGSFGQLRLEGEVSFRTADIDRLEFNRVAMMSDGDFDTLAGMVNGYLDLTTISDRVTPYIGGGIGVARLDSNVRYGNATINDDDTVFAWQVMAGITFRLGDRFDLFGEARYFDTDDADLNRFGGPPPPESARLTTDLQTIDGLGGIRIRF